MRGTFRVADTTRREHPDRDGCTVTRAHLYAQGERIEK
jgi:hypothetical protein